MSAGAATDDVLGAYRAIVAWVDPRVEGAADLQAPTPCTGWDVGTVLFHVVAGIGFFTAMGRDGRVDDAQLEYPDFTSSSPIEWYRTAAAESLGVWSEPGRLEQICEMPFGSMPGREALGIHAADLLVHGWDLAVASSQPAAMDDDLARFALEVERGFVRHELRGPDGPFGPEVSTDPSASPEERLLGFVGRSSQPPA